MAPYGRFYAMLTEMPSQTASSITFSERFCAQEGILPSNYVEVALKRTLYPAARLLHPLLNLSPTYFGPDREFIRCIGRLTRSHDFEAEVFDYRMDPANRGFLRRVLRLRVSVHRLQHFVHRVMRNSSGSPFSARAGSTREEH